MEIPSPSAAVAPCRVCTHAKEDHPAGMFGCVKAIGLCRCPCWQYAPATPAPQEATARQQIQHSKIGRRPAKDELERWAAAGLKKLAGLDSDGARDLNGVGFNKNDSEIGHSLARQAGSMTEKQWATAVRIARHYHRQIGQPPAATAAGKEA